jgi:hypothetical protein
MQIAAVPTLDVNRFDSQADQCFDFFSKQGYKKVANVLEGNIGNRTMFAAGFCGYVDKEAIKRGTGTATKGLEPSLKPVAAGQCYNHNAEVTSGTPRYGLTTLDLAVFVGTLVLWGLRFC